MQELGGRPQKGFAIVWAGDNEGLNLCFLLTVVEGKDV